MKNVVYHLVISVYYALSLWYDQEYVASFQQTFPNDFEILKGRLKYLTLINMLLQATFFTICTLNDLIGSNKDYIRKKPLIRKLKDGMLSSLAFPLSMFVGITFWALYAIDRELVFPKVLDKFFPSWLNHVMHTNIMIFILLEMYTSYAPYPPRKVGLTVLGVFMALYLVWIHVIYSYTGTWVYPVLEVLSLPGRIVFFVGLLGLSMSLYIFGEKLNSKIWSPESRNVETTSHRKVR